MNIPILQGIIDLTQLQNTMALLLCDDDRLAAVPVLPEIKLHQESELMVDALWTLPRNAFKILPTGWEISQSGSAGATGCGLLVEHVEATCPAPNVSGPPLTWKVHIVAFEERNANLTPGTGIGLMSEQLAQLVLDVLAGQYIYGLGAFTPSSTPIAPAHDWMSLKPGIFATRATVEATVKRPQSVRSLPPSATFGAGQCTLACADAAAEIRYTLDGSMPLRTNTRSQVYNSAFAVNSGDQILAATRAAGKIGSAIIGFAAP